MRIPSRTEKQKIAARAKCGNLYLKNPNISWVLDDESYFTLRHSTVNGNGTFYSSEISKTPASVKYNPLKKFEPKLLVCLCISDPIFRQSGMAVNINIYIDFIKKCLLSKSITLMKNISFGRSSHYATEVVNFYRDKKIKFVEKHENTANVPMWSILKAKVYEKGFDLAQLKCRIRYCLRKMDLNLVYRLLAGTSARLNRVRMYGLIKDQE